MNHKPEGSTLQACSTFPLHHLGDLSKQRLNITNVQNIKGVHHLNSDMSFSWHRKDQSVCVNMSYSLKAIKQKTTYDMIDRSMKLLRQREGEREEWRKLKGEGKGEKGKNHSGSERDYARCAPK